MNCTKLKPQYKISPLKYLLLLIKVDIHNFKQKEKHS